MTTHAYQIIREALLNKKQVHAMYEWYFREFCPHVIWLKGYQERVLGYQFWGQSSKWTISSHVPEWRCFEIEKLSNIQVIDWEWYSDEHTFHTRKNSCIEHPDLFI